VTVHRYLACVNIEPGDLLTDDGVDADDVTCQACLDGDWTRVNDEEVEEPPAPVAPVVPPTPAPAGTNCYECNQGRHAWNRQVDSRVYANATDPTSAVRCHCGAWRPGYGPTYPAVASNSTTNIVASVNTVWV
jgi:hypothetical protein